MNPKYVTSLEISERLKAAGFPQDALHAWVKYSGKDIKGSGTTDDVSLLEDAKFSITSKAMRNLGVPHEVFAAPMSDELLEQLKPLAKQNKWDNGWNMVKVILCWDDIDKDWGLEWQNTDEWNPLFNLPIGSEDTVPNLLAELWLYCKENRLLG